MAAQTTMGRIALVVVGAMSFGIASAPEAAAAHIPTHVVSVPVMSTMTAQSQSLARTINLHATLDANTVLQTAAPSPLIQGYRAPAEARHLTFTNEAGLTRDAVAIGRLAHGEFGVEHIGGRTRGGHVSKSDHYTGKAVDLMFAAMTAESSAAGWELADYLVDHAYELNIHYLIWEGKIWKSYQPEKGWQNYTHPSGSKNATKAHFDHIHVSVL